MPITFTQHLKAVPSIVHTDDTARVFWGVENAASCSVTGTNADVWNTLTSGSSGKTTSPITGRTVYTLLCHALPGAIPATAQESVTVNIAPSFQEL